LDTFRGVLTALPDGDLPPCPHCGRFDLEVRFVADPETRVGSAAMWSDFCRYGLRVSRVSVPDAVAFIYADASPEVLAAQIPQFTEIGPSGPVGRGAQSGSDPAAVIARLLLRRGPLTARQIADELALQGNVAARLDRLVAEGLVARAGDSEAPTGIEPVYTALQAAA
jgi:hypothetical protein